MAAIKARRISVTNTTMIIVVCEIGLEEDEVSSMETATGRSDAIFSII
jgi:hypothetical protein